MAAEDRFAALEAKGLMQQGFIPELEDVMARAIAEVEAGGIWVVDEVQAGSVRAAALVQAQRAEPSTVVEAVEDGMAKHCSRSCRGWDGFQQDFLPPVWFTLELLAIEFQLL